MTQPPTQNYAQPPQSSTNGFAIAALVLGIVGLLFSITLCFSWLGVLLGVVGLILGIVGLGAAKKSDGKTGMAMTGTVLSGAAILIGIVIYIGFFVFADRVGGGLENLAEKGQMMTAAQVEAQADADDAIADGADPQRVASLQQSAASRLSGLTLDGSDADEMREKVDEILEDYREKLRQAVEEAGSTTEGESDN